MARRAALRKPLELVKPAEPIKLDFGCGMRCQPGFEGVDVVPFVGVKHVMDVRKAPWPWPDNSVSEAHASHFVEHLTGVERYTFFNELWRVLVPDGKCLVITPHWASCRAYGDPTHQWPPVSEFTWHYLSRDWRKTDAPHTDAEHVPGTYRCHFLAIGGYGMRADLLTRAQDYQQFAVANYKEAAQDMVTTLTALKG